MNPQSDFDKALKDPTLVYHNPDEILSDTRLDDAQRMQILKRWEQDERELDVAQEEGMIGGESSILGEILNAMEKLGVDQNPTEAPTKHGGSVD